MTQLTAAQAAQQANRDGAGRYSSKVHSESSVDLSPAVSPQPGHVRNDAIRASAELDRVVADLDSADTKLNDARLLPASEYRTDR